MSLFRVSYTFVDRFESDADVIRRALRDLSFSTAFHPRDVSAWTVTEPEPGRHVKILVRPG